MLEAETKDLTCKNSLGGSQRAHAWLSTMSEKKKENEPDYAVLDAKEGDLIRDTTVKEKFQVFELSKRISRYLSGLLFATGAISILLSGEYFLGARLMLAIELKSIFLFALGFTGVVNLVVGLLLLTKE